MPSRDASSSSWEGRGRQRESNGFESPKGQGRREYEGLRKPNPHCMLARVEASGLGDAGLCVNRCSGLAVDAERMRGVGVMRACCLRRPSLPESSGSCRSLDRLAPRHGALLGNGETMAAVRRQR